MLNVEVKKRRRQAFTFSFLIFHFSFIISVLYSLQHWIFNIIHSIFLEWVPYTQLELPIQEPDVIKPAVIFIGKQRIFYFIGPV